MFNPWAGKIPWRRVQLPTPAFWPAEFHGWRSLVGYSPLGCKASDMTEGFSCGLAGKEACLQCGRPGFDPWTGKSFWRRERLPTPVFWPGEFHSSWGHNESDTTE